MFNLDNCFVVVGSIEVNIIKKRRKAKPKSFQYYIKLLSPPQSDFLFAFQAL